MIQETNKIIDQCYWTTLKTVQDFPDGSLNIAEANVQIPFEIKRVYYITDLYNHNAIRGRHAHKELEQVLFTINGKFKIELDNGIEKKELVLSPSSPGIYMKPKVWHTMKNFTSDCIILVFASEKYNESDYLRDYNEFKKYCQKNE